MITTCTKRFNDFPFAHRQHLHKGHCALIHGHNWDFEITFMARKLDENGFVVDFGKLKWIREWLENHFDHTLVLNEGDPMLDYLLQSLENLNPTDMDTRGINLAKIIVVPNAGAEGLARFVFDWVQQELHLREDTTDRVYVKSVTVWENTRNCATVAAI